MIEIEFHLSSRKLPDWNIFPEHLGFHSISSPFCSSLSPWRANNLTRNQENITLLKTARQYNGRLSGRTFSMTSITRPSEIMLNDPERWLHTIVSSSSQIWSVTFQKESVPYDNDIFSNFILYFDFVSSFLFFYRFFPSFLFFTLLRRKKSRKRDTINNHIDYVRSGKRGDWSSLSFNLSPYLQTFTTRNCNKVLPSGADRHFRSVDKDRNTVQYLQGRIQKGRTFIEWNMEIFSSSLVFNLQSLIKITYQLCNSTSEVTKG